VENPVEILNKEQNLDFRCEIVVREADLKLEIVCKLLFPG
jgi:hypothetical protein